MPNKERLYLSISTLQLKIDEFWSPFSNDDAPPTNFSTSFYSPPNLNCTSEGLDEIISTVGSFRRLILHPEQLPHSNEIAIPCSNEYDMITESNIKRRKLTFNEEALSIEFIDPQRWKTGMLHITILIYS